MEMTEGAGSTATIGRMVMDIGAKKKVKKPKKGIKPVKAKKGKKK